MSLALGKKSKFNSLTTSDLHIPNIDSPIDKPVFIAEMSSNSDSFSEEEDSMYGFQVVTKKRSFRPAPSITSGTMNSGVSSSRNSTQGLLQDDKKFSNPKKQSNSKTLNKPKPTWRSPCPIYAGADTKFKVTDHLDIKLDDNKAHVDPDGAKINPKNAVLRLRGGSGGRNLSKHRNPNPKEGGPLFTNPSDLMSSPQTGTFHTWISK
jgi:hypothetical protein